MKTSLFKVILLTLVLTGIVFFMKLYHEPEGNSIEKKLLNEKRHLQNITQQSYSNLCVKTNVTYGYSEKFVGLANSVEGYINILSTYKNGSKEQIQDVIVNDNTSKIPSLVASIFGGWIVLAIFGVITFISWFVYCGCCCRPCLCCKSTVKDENWCSLKGISCIIILVSLVGVVASCIIGWIFASDFPTELDNLQCSLYRFYVDTKYGENKTTTPRWIGIDGVYDKLVSLSDALNTVSSNSQNTNYDTSKTSQTQSSYYQLLDTKYSDNSNVQTSNPNPQSTTASVTPAFIQTWGPKEKNGTTLNLLKLEYDFNILGATQLLQQFQIAKNILNQNIADGRTALLNAANQIKPVSAQFDVFEVNYISKFADNVRIILFYFLKL